MVADKFAPRPYQAPIVDEIADIYGANGTAVALLHGSPGSGKSIISILLAKKLHGGLCPAFDPTMPGVELSKLYSFAIPEPAAPLIIVIEEVDVIFERIHSQTVVENSRTPTSVRNKSDWNRLLDDISIGLYPNLILLLTSNMDPAALTAKYDPAYIRPGRVNKIFHV